ncbi:hypothetical protein HPP92_000728 [Vanilla planifolia]|nr:hypothetical protein HPP92_000728 [Vanilla planifolia]
MEQFVHSLERYGPHREDRAGVWAASGKSPISYAGKQEQRKECCSAGFSSGKESFSARLGRCALRKREGMRGKKKSLDKDELSEDYCFVCKDGGEIRVCDFK